MNKFEGHDWSYLYYENEECKCEHCVQERLDLHAKVSRGAELFDSVVPDWWQKVDVGTLDMSCPCKPGHVAVQVLGSPEVTKSYDAFKILFGMSIDEAPMYGLWPQRHISHALNKAWMGLTLRRHIESVCL